MKPLYLLATIVFLGAAGATATAQDTTWYTHDWDSTTRANAFYMRVRTASGEGWKISSMGLDGTPVRTYTMLHDTLDGPESIYYPNGKLEITGMENKGSWDGDWIAYFPSGKVLAKATYRLGRPVTTTFYHEDGSRDPGNKVFMAESEYPGGAGGWLDYLTTHLRYPKSAVRQKAEGRVVVEFVVTAAGKPTNFVIIRSSGNEALDKEALRVVKESGKWEPATQLGVQVNSYKKQPVVFRLQQ